MKPVRLFSDYDLHSVLENEKTKIRELVNRVPASRLVTEDFEALVYEVAEGLREDPITLELKEITTHQAEAQVDVSRDFQRAISDRSRPFYINGISVKYYVPFNGDANLFRCRPNTFSTSIPYAIVENKELIFEFHVTDGNILSTKARFEHELAEVQKWLSWIDTQIRDYNAGLSNLVRPHLDSRRKLIETSNSQADELGFKPRQQRETTPSENVVSDNKTARKPVTARDTPRSDKKSIVPDKQYDVALSFAGENRNYVDEVAGYLKSAGVAVFYDGFEGVDLWGKNLIDHLGKVYSKQSRFIVMFISEHYALKSWPNHERKSAQDRALKMQEDCILPVRFDETEIPGMPGTIAFIDARSTTPSKLAERIVQKINSK